MKKRGRRLIVGSALSLAAILAAVDHTRHRLPEPQAADSGEAGGQSASAQDETPCGLGEQNPCGLGEDNPCGLGESANPCSL